MLESLALRDILNEEVGSELMLTVNAAPVGGVTNVAAWGSVDEDLALARARDSGSKFSDYIRQSFTAN
jgi:hypothetical protein